MNPSLTQGTRVLNLKCAQQSAHTASCAPHLGLTSDLQARQAAAHVLRIVFPACDQLSCYYRFEDTDMRCNLALVKLENVRSLPTLGINCNPRWQGMANATFITFRDLASVLKRIHVHLFAEVGGGHEQIIGIACFGVGVVMDPGQPAKPGIAKHTHSSKAAPAEHGLEVLRKVLGDVRQERPARYHPARLFLRE